MEIIYMTENNNRNQGSSPSASANKQSGSQTHSNRSEGGKKAAEKRGHESLSEAGKKGGEASKGGNR